MTAGFKSAYLTPKPVSCQWATCAVIHLHLLCARGQVYSREQAPESWEVYTPLHTPVCQGQGKPQAEQSTLDKKTENDKSVLDTEVRGESLKAHCLHIP